jgi:DGQHR domain-containing protein
MNATSRVVGCIIKHKQYVITVKPPAAQDLLFTSTYDSEDPLSNAPDRHGYQRPPTNTRFPEIANYFLESDNADKITPLIVSVRIKDPKDIERFLAFVEAGDITAIKTHFGSKIASLIDGQHRKGGLIHAWLDDNSFMPEIPLIVYFGLTFIQEAELFNTINVTQRKLPKALIETTKGDITESDDTTYAQKIRRVTFSLCRDPDSVWGPENGEEQINMTGVRDPNRPVTYEGLRRSTANMFPTTLLSRLEAIDEGLPLKYAKRYWRAVSEECKEAWTGHPSTREVVDPITGEKSKVKIQYRIKDLVGVAALAKLAKDIITSDIESKEPKKLEDLTSKLMEVDWEKRDDNPWMRSQAGFAGQKDLYEMLHALVYNDKHPGSTGFSTATLVEEQTETA